MISNDDVARTLERVADLLEIRGENAFKVRAYRLAASQVENISESLSDVAERDELRDIDGFGSAIADKVQELLTSGRLAYLEKLETEVPPTLVAICRLPGVGPHNVRLRGRALRLGMTLNEYGVFDLENGDRAAGDSEASGYAVLGLDWIPPQEREDRGEIARASRANIQSALIAQEV